MNDRTRFVVVCALVAAAALSASAVVVHAELGLALQDESLAQRFAGPQPAPVRPAASTAS